MAKKRKIGRIKVNRFTVVGEENAGHTIHIDIPKTFSPQAVKILTTEIADHVAEWASDFDPEHFDPDYES